MFRHPDKSNQDNKELLVSSMTPVEKLLHDIEGLSEELEPIQAALKKVKRKVVLLNYFVMRDQLRKDKKNDVEARMQVLQTSSSANQHTIHTEMLKIERSNVELIKAMQQQAVYYAEGEKVPSNFSNWSPQLANRVRVGLDREYQHYLTQKQHANFSKKILEAQTTFSTLRTTFAELSVQLNEKTASLDSLIPAVKREEKYLGPANR